MSRIIMWLLCGAFCVAGAAVLVGLTYVGWQRDFEPFYQPIEIEASMQASKPAVSPQETQHASAHAPRAMPIPAYRWDGCVAGDSVCALAEALYFEGRSVLNDPLASRAIAAVILNRRNHAWYPDTIFGVVYHVREVRGRTLCELSYQCERHRVVWEPRAMMRAKALALTILLEVADGTFEDPTRGAIFYCMPKACGKDLVSFHPSRHTLTAEHKFYAGGRAPQKLELVPPARPEARG